VEGLRLAGSPGLVQMVVEHLLQFVDHFGARLTKLDSTLN
jgi:hypothetical protein